MSERISVDLKQDPKVIFGSRMFGAPRDLVFEAWTRPEHLAEWWGPNGFSITTHAFEFKPGGIWRFVMHGPDGRDYQNRVTFDEIVRPERIAYHHGGGDDVKPIQFRTIATFEDVGGKTRLNWRATFPSAEARDHVIKEYGADKGLVQTLTRLGDYLKTLASRSTSMSSSEDFVITRTLDAPRDLVWKAWTEPVRLAQWWGPKECTIRVAKLDVRPGGMFHYAMQFKPGHDIWGRFVYREIESPERLVFVNSFSDATGGITRAPFPQLGDSWPLEILNTLTLTELGGQTTLTLRGSPINATEEERKTFVGMLASMQQGWSGTFEKLEAYLAGAA